MKASNDLLNRIKLKYDGMSKGNKRLSDFIRSNPEKALYMTAAKMGEAVGVSESTVVRFATLLGYKGYPEFQHGLEELVRNSMNSVQRMEAASGRMNQSSVLKSVLMSDVENLKKTADQISPEDFDHAVETLIAARRIYVIGVRSCAPLASFLVYYMKLVFDNVHQLITSTSSELFEQMVHVGPEDVIIGISFPRYSKRTQRALEFASNRGAQVIALTDSPNSPLCQYASCSLIACSDMTSVADSLVAPLSVINALLAAVFMKKKDEIKATLTELEHIWEEYQVYDEPEMKNIHEMKNISDMFHDSYPYPSGKEYNE